MGSINIYITLMVLSILIPHSTGYDGSTEYRVNQICQSLERSEFNYCFDFYKQHVPGDYADMKRLTQISLTQTLIYATDTRIFLQRSQDKERDAQTKNLYEICITGYGFLMNQFEEANLAFAKIDYRSVVFEVERCERFVNDCQNVLGGGVPSVSDRNFHARALVKMSLISTRLIG